MSRDYVDESVEEMLSRLCHEVADLTEAVEGLGVVSRPKVLVFRDGDRRRFVSLDAIDSLSTSMGKDGQTPFVEINMRGIGDITLYGKDALEAVTLYADHITPAYFGKEIDYWPGLEKPEAEPPDYEAVKRIRETILRCEDEKGATVSTWQLQVSEALADSLSKIMQTDLRALQLVGYPVHVCDLHGAAWAFAPRSEEKTEICECCGEEWEGSFFCDTCSNEGELVEMDTPRLFWDGCGPDMETTEEWVYYATCYNCCPGHRKGSEAATTPLRGEFIDDEEILF